MIPPTSPRTGLTEAASPSRTTRWSLRASTVAIALAAGCIVAVVALWQLSHSLGQAHQEEAGALAAATARVTAQSIDSDLSDRTADVMMMAGNTQRYGIWRDPAGLQSRVEMAQQIKPGFSWIGFAGADGTITAATGRLAVGANVSQRSWFRGGAQALYHGDLHEAILLQKALPPLPKGEPWRFVDVSTPVHDASGQLVGVFAAHLSWPWMRSRMDVAAATMPEGGTLWILGPDDRPRYGTPDAAQAPLKLEAVRRARAGQSGWTVETWPDGRRYVTGYSPNLGNDRFSGFGWLTLVRVPADAWPVATAAEFRSFAWAALALVLLMAGVAWGCASLWLRPLHRFIAQVALMRQGEAAPVLTGHHPREFHDLHAAIGRLAQQLNEKEARALQAFEDMRHSFASVGKSLPGVLSTFRLKGDEIRFSYVSEGAALYFGVLPQSMLNDRQGWARHADPVDAQALREAFLPLRNGDQYMLSLPMRFKGSDGQRRTLHNIIVRRDDQDARVFDWISLDITELVAAREAAERANRAKGDFLATMSHEIRTPLNAILGFSRVLEDTLTDERQQRQAHFIRETGEVLTRVLNDVLDLARVDSGKFALDPRPFELDQVLEGCRAIYRVTALQRGLSFQVESPKGLPPLVGDPIRLRQVMENLLANAMKFTTTGAVSLRTSVLDTREQADGRQEVQVCLRVTDTGIGMTPEQVGRVFERFEQADRSIKIRYGGAGLGLAIVKALVKAMGGDIQVVSVEGSGSEFSVTIPFEVAAGALTHAPDEVNIDVPERPLRVLVADDLNLNRIVIRTLLEGRGHEVIEAADGVEAVQQVREQRPDLVLMDLDMPNLDGWEAARRLRGSTGPERDTPIWALTGKAFSEDVQSCWEAGMDGHLAKPIVLEDLVRVLRRAAGGRTRVVGAGRT